MRYSGKMKRGLLACAFASSLRRIHDLLVVQGLRRVSVLWRFYRFRGRYWSLIHWFKNDFDSLTDWCTTLSTSDVTISGWVLDKQNAHIEYRKPRGYKTENKRLKLKFSLLRKFIFVWIMKNRFSRMKKYQNLRGGRRLSSGNFMLILFIDVARSWRFFESLSVRDCIVSSLLISEQYLLRFCFKLRI